MYYCLMLVMLLVLAPSSYDNIKKLPVSCEEFNYYTYYYFWLNDRAYVADTY